MQASISVNFRAAGVFPFRSADAGPDRVWMVPFRNLDCLRPFRYASPVRLSGIRHAAAFAIGVVFSCSAGAVVIRDGAGLGEAAALAAAYPSAGWLEVEEGASRFRGSGVLVAPGWVLTAAHNWDAVRVTGMRFHIAGAAYEAADWLQHPGWTGAVGAAQGWDIALVRLAGPVPGVAPAALSGGSAELGSGVVVVGAGRVGTPAGGLDFNLAARLFGVANVIDRVVPTAGPEGPGGLLALDFDDGSAARNTLAGDGIYDVTGAPIPGPGSGSDAVPLALEGTTAGGDSGGPVFADFGDGPEVVGLVSWGVNPSEPSDPYGSGYGDVGYLTRVSPFRDWILHAIPEPGVPSLVLAGLLAVACLRRR